MAIAARSAPETSTFFGCAPRQRARVCNEEDLGDRAGGRRVELSPHRRDGALEPPRKSGVMPLGSKIEAARHHRGIEIEEQCTANHDAIADLGTRRAADLAAADGEIDGRAQFCRDPLARQASITEAANVVSIRDLGRGTHPNGRTI
jgi:hypothetical protein